MILKVTSAVATSSLLAFFKLQHTLARMHSNRQKSHTSHLFNWNHRTERHTLYWVWLFLLSSSCSILV